MHRAMGYLTGLLLLLPASTALAQAQRGGGGRGGGGRGGAGARPSAFRAPFRGTTGGGYRGAARGVAPGITGGGWRGATYAGSPATTGAGWRGAVRLAPAGVGYGGLAGGRALAPLGAASGARTTTGVGRFATGAGLAGYSRLGRAGHLTRRLYTRSLRTQAGWVRGNFGYYDLFAPDWYRAYPSWWPSNWVGGGVWDGVGWPVLADWLGSPPAPTYYNYGTTVIIRDNTIYVNGEPTSPAADYAEQAIELAAGGREAKVSDKADWRPLGVFALAQDEETTAHDVFQLAVNRAGAVRGNYYDALSDTTQMVRGAVDKKTQRVAWTIGDRKDLVFETGLYNLTRKETSVLVHFGKERTRQWLLARVEPPRDRS